MPAMPCHNPALKLSVIVLLSHPDQPSAGCHAVAAHRLTVIRRHLTGLAIVLATARTGSLRHVGMPPRAWRRRFSSDRAWDHARGGRRLAEGRKPGRGPASCAAGLPIKTNNLAASY